MKKLFAVLLYAVASVAMAQSLTIGGGAFAGSQSASSAVMALAMGNAGGLADLGVVSKNEGTANAVATTGLVIAPIPALASGGTGTSQNTTTLTMTGSAPIGSLSYLNGAGAGNSFAAGGVIYYLTTTTPGPTPPIILPTPPGPVQLPVLP